MRPRARASSLELSFVYYLLHIRAMHGQHKKCSMTTTYFVRFVGLPLVGKPFSEYQAYEHA
jgi:hypothetical protein